MHRVSYYLFLDVLFPDGHRGEVGVFIVVGSSPSSIAALCASAFVRGILLAHAGLSGCQGHAGGRDLLFPLCLRVCFSFAPLRDALSARVGPAGECFQGGPPLLLLKRTAAE